MNFSLHFSWMFCTDFRDRTAAVPHTDVDLFQSLHGGAEALADVLREVDTYIHVYIQCSASDRLMFTSCSHSELFGLLGVGGQFLLR